MRGKEKIGLRAGKVLNRYQLAKHFGLEIEAARFSCRRKETKIGEEAALDGIDVIHTSAQTETFSPPGAVWA